MAAPTVLLFDLGGVLVETVGLEQVRGLLGDGLSAEEVRRRWVTSPVIHSFERGECSAAEFAEAFIAEWHLAIGPDEFLARFRRWVIAPFAESLELLETLRGRYTLACLSNTSEAHWDLIMRDFGLGRCFDHAFASHLIGLTKPDRAVYQWVVRELDRPPAEFLFFDDVPENVEGARGAGMDARLVRGPAELRRELGRAGLL